MYTKTYHELDDSIPHEYSIKNMIDFAIEGCWGRVRFRNELTISYGCKPLRSTGGYDKHPFIRISDSVNTGTIYEEVTILNKSKAMGAFFGEPEYILQATVAHNLVHAIAACDYITNTEWGYGQRQKLHGTFWRVLYSQLREKFVNPYVSQNIGNQFTVNHNESSQKNIDKLYRKYNIKMEKLTCKDCGEKYIPKRCPHGLTHLNDDGRCMDCHIEVSHCVVPDPARNIPDCGNQIGYTEDDIWYFPRICDRFYRV